MACMDHECVACGYAWMDNACARSCPECGARVTNHFDEDKYDLLDDRDDLLHDDDDRDEPFDGADDEP